MATLRFTVLAIFLSLSAATLARADEKKPAIGDNQFRRASILLLENPLDDSAKDYARAIMVFPSQSPKAAVFLGRESAYPALRADGRPSPLACRGFTAAEATWGRFGLVPVSRPVR